MTDVIFVVRSDSDTKPGGDSLQVDQYAQELRRLGLSVEVLPWRTHLPQVGNAIIVAVNVDRPYEFLLLNLGRSNKTYVVVPIHHSDRAIARLRRSEASASTARRILSVLPSRVRELLTFYSRLAASGDGGARFTAGLRAFAYMPRLRSAVRRRLEGADLVMTLSRTETEALERDFRVEHAKYVITPNGVPRQDGVRNEWLNRKIGIVVVGRIEPRKRSLEVLRAADALGIGVTFIGKVDANSSKYGRQFVSEIEKSANSEWLGVHPHADVARYLGDSRVLLNASLAEVQSLVEIEAAEAGCRVVTTQSGSAQEYVQSVAEIFPAEVELTELLSAAHRAASRLEGPELYSYPHTWTSAVAPLARLLGVSADVD